MHQSCRVPTVADEIGNVVDDGDFRVDHRVPAADATHSQVPDVQLVADLNCLPRSAELGRRLRVGVESGLRVCVDERGQSCGIDVVGMLMGDQDRRQPGDALEPMGEAARVEQHRGFVFSALGEARQETGMTEMCELHAYILSRHG